MCQLLTSQNLSSLPSPFLRNTPFMPNNRKYMPEASSTYVFRLDHNILAAFATSRHFRYVSYVRICRICRLSTEIMLSGCRRFGPTLSNANIEFARFKEQCCLRVLHQYRCSRRHPIPPNIQFPGASARKKVKGATKEMHEQGTVCDCMPFVCGKCEWSRWCTASPMISHFRPSGVFRGDFVLVQFCI